MRKRFLLKALLCVIGIFVLIYIAVTFHYKKIQDGNAPYIESEVVKAELAAMSDALENQVYDSLLDEGNNFKEEYLTFRDLKEITKQYPHGDISMFESDDFLMQATKLLTGELSLKLTIITSAAMPAVSIGAYYISYIISCRLYAKGAMNYDG